MLFLIKMEDMLLGNDRGPGTDSGPGRGLDFFPGPCPGRGNQNNWPGQGATDCYIRVSFLNITLIFARFLMF